MDRPIGIIAGEAKFPLLVAQGAKQQGKKVIAVGFQGYTRPELFSLVDRMCWLKLGQLGKLISFFKKQGVQEIVFAGAINKPRALDLRPDFKAACLLLHLKNKNDNALISAVVQTLEKEGFSIAPPLAFVPNLQVPSGVLSKRSPSKTECQDIAFGLPIAKQIGALDIGQCLVVKDQMVVAVEAMEGTNNTILRGGKLAGPGCVIIKTFKPGQEEHIDQPAIGLETIETMIKAQATCLAIESDKSLFFDREKALELANRHELAIIGLDLEELDRKGGETEAR